jgi:hypothetical protein
MVDWEEYGSLVKKDLGTRVLDGRVRSLFSVIKIRPLLAEFRVKISVALFKLLWKLAPVDLMR